MKRAVILNSRSGTAPDEKTLREALAEGHVEADVLCLPPDGQVGALVDKAAAAYDVLIAAGGDGTVSTVAAAASQAGKIFGVIPAGTLNHFARDAGIPSELAQAIAVLHEGHTRPFDIGTVNGRIFINNASIGAYPRMVWDRNRARRKGLPRPLAIAFAALNTWIDLRGVTARLVVDGRELIRRSPFIFIGNSEYEIEGIEMGRRPTMTDGRLSLYIAPDCGRLDAIVLPARAVLRMLPGDGKLEVMRASTITMEPSRRKVSVALDGEIRMLDAPLKFGVETDALETLVPGGAARPIPEGEEAAA